MDRALRRGLPMTLIAVIIVLSGSRVGASIGGNHGGTVPETPRTDVPRVLDGRLYDAAEVGDTILVGGSFTQIQVGGSTQNRPGLFAFDATTGALRTVVPSISGTVYTIEPAGGDSILNWSDNGGTHVIRRNDRWLATPGAGTTTYTDTNSPPDATYLIRTWDDGTRTDRTCTAA